MLKNGIKFVAYVALFTSLTSCSYYNSWFGKKADANPNFRTESEIQDPTLDDANASAEKLLNAQHYDASLDPRCEDNKFTSARDKLQTLGYLPSGYELPKPTKPYKAEHHHKKHAKKVHKPVKKESTAHKAEAMKAEVKSEVDSMKEALVEKSEPAKKEASQAAASALPDNPGMKAGIPPVESAAESASASVVMEASRSSLNFAESELELSDANKDMLNKIASALKADAKKSLKVESYAYLASGAASDARRNALERAIKIRKYLIEQDISASRITVNAVEDVNMKMNKIDLILEEVKS